jgi:hypothetical protein
MLNTLTIDSTLTDRPFEGLNISMGYTKACPCEPCYYRKYCTRTGKTCPLFRIWARTGKLKTNYARLPDEQET